MIVFLEEVASKGALSGIDIEQVIQEVQDGVIDFGPKILAALAILVGGYFISKIISSIVRRVMVRSKIDRTIATFISKIAYIALMAFVAIAAVGELGVQTGSFIAIIGAAGLAIGFALQGSLSNFAAGVMIIMFRPFKIGDTVEVAGEVGSIKSIEVFATTLLRPDNKRVIIPNSAIMSGNISNYSAETRLRVDIVAGIGYDDDIKKAKEVLLRICSEHPKVLKEPAPLVAVSELASSSINFIVRPWTLTGDYWSTKFDILESIKYEFDKVGISIPFPQQDVHMHQVA